MFDELNTEKWDKDTLEAALNFLHGNVDAYMHNIELMAKHGKHSKVRPYKYGYEDTPDEEDL